MARKSFMAFCFLFVISLSFPVAASLIRVPYKIFGYLDITTASILLTLALIIYMKRSAHKIKGVRRLQLNIYKIILMFPLALMLVFFLQVEIRWDILLIGLAWRFWLLSLILEELVQIYVRKLHAPFSSDKLHVHS